MEDMDQLLTFVLPDSLCPGNDQLSKAILKDQMTIDLITKSLLDTPANTYTTDDTEWPDRTRCDVLYVPKLAVQSSLPPVLIEVQQIVNNDFLRRAFRYAMNIIDKYDMRPVLLIFCVQGIQPASLREKLIKHPAKPWSLKYPDHQLWTKDCLFFSAKQPALANHEHSDDNTVQKMYALAKSFSTRHGEYQQNFYTTMESFCTTSEKLWESTPPPLPPKLRITDKAKTKTDDTEEDELAFAISYQQSYQKTHGSKKSWQACLEAMATMKAFVSKLSTVMQQI
ncbi:hypothetical protein BDB00DRAFT_787278 [Zychaea mexicana]|uniref:uncharacterized protein n=1 Tax=Zychaea mexicana TaxID=64656 RepID=UPI0022FEAC84|nr:uncharacterized protein BDB00DRAFT_787278 [Zychaea mexicana]KAI9494230.1 hypothetical protein BDB00DRAFT_787278 [Zychaea mexicana]